MNLDQITADHRRRLAYVYIRQSSQQQVLHHRESQRRQRSLQERACELGWPREQVVVVDEDLGQSAARSQDRSGFQKMVAAAALGEVGLILALEPSRLSRGNRNWYHLLDVCAVTRTLLADDEGLYDPSAYNDRLLLGLKGTMSEAELHLIKQRLVEAMRARAQRGEFRLRLPPGYVWDEAGRIEKHADDQVRSVIGLIFRRFSELGTIGQVQQALKAEGVLVPVLNGPGHSLRWGSPSYGSLQRVLKSPIYAGAYVYGRTQMVETLDHEQQPQKQVRKRPREQWPVLIEAHHAGYITWQTYEQNQHQIASNRRGPLHVGAPREGQSLLQGLVLCGRCGRRMKLEYSGGRRSVRFSCHGGERQNGAPKCQSFGVKRLERAVAQLVLTALEPVGVEAMLAAVEAYSDAAGAEREHWRQRLARARYEVDLARRQYELVDPANRLVASELERRWEKALQELAAVENEAAARAKALDRPLTAIDREHLHRYASDLPRLWHEPSTRHQDRKRIVRCLVENVVISKVADSANLEAAVHWVGGEVTRIEVANGRTGARCHIATPELLQLIRDLAAEFSDDQIARILSRKKLHTPTGLSFTARRVTGLRYSNGIAGTTSASFVGEDIYTAEQAGELLGVARGTVIRWVEVGLLKGRQLTSGAPWRIRVTAADRQHLTASDAPAGWLPLKGAALALGVSQQTVLQRLKCGELDGIRVCTGRRSAWRINVPATSYQDQTMLFD